MNSGGDNNFGQNPSGANPWASSTPNNPMQSNPAATPVQPIQPTQPDLGPAPFAGPSSANLSQSVSGTPMMMGGGFNAPAGPIVSSGAGTAPAAPITPRPSGMPARRQFRSTKATPAAPVATPTAMRSDTPDFFSQAYTDNVMQANANAYDQAVKKGKMKKILLFSALGVVLLAGLAGLMVFLSAPRVSLSAFEENFNTFGNYILAGEEKSDPLPEGKLAYEPKIIKHFREPLSDDTTAYMERAKELLADVYDTLGQKNDKNQAYYDILDRYASGFYLIYIISTKGDISDGEIFADRHEADGLKRYEELYRSYGEDCSDVVRYASSRYKYISIIRDFYAAVEPNGCYESEIPDGECVQTVIDQHELQPQLDEALEFYQQAEETRSIAEYTMSSNPAGVLKEIKELKSDE